MGIEPTHQLVTGALVLKTRRPTRRLGTSVLLLYAIRPSLSTNRAFKTRIQPLYQYAYALCAE